MRRDIQMIFQDPFASLDPRLTVGFSIAEPLYVHGVAKGRAAEERVAWLLRHVGLSPDLAQRYPARVLGRSAAADRRCARARAQSEDHHRRRSRVGARRFDPGADRQPAARPAERVRSFLPLHLARHGGGRAREPPRRGDVPGPDRRDRTAARDLREPAAPLHAQTDGSCARRRPRAAAPQDGVIVRRDSEPDPRRRRRAVRCMPLREVGAGPFRRDDTGSPVAY